MAEKYDNIFEYHIEADRLPVHQYPENRLPLPQQGLTQINLDNIHTACVGVHYKFSSRQIPHLSSGSQPGAANSLMNNSFALLAARRSRPSWGSSENQTRIGLALSKSRFKP